MTSKEALEIFLKLVDPQDESEWENCQKAHIKLKQDLEILEEIRNTFKVINYGKQENPCYLLIDNKFNYAITKESYNKWLRWLENDK